MSKICPSKKHLNFPSTVASRKSSLSGARMAIALDNWVAKAKTSKEKNGYIIPGQCERVGWIGAQLEDIGVAANGKDCQRSSNALVTCFCQAKL